MKKFLSLLVLTMLVMNVEAEVNYTLSPSNTDSIEAYKMRNFSITFTDVDSIYIEKDLMSDNNTEFEITYNDSVSIHTTHAREVEYSWHDKWKVTGNTLSITLIDPLEKVQESGEYHVHLRHVKVGDEMVDLDIPYQFTVSRCDPEVDIPFTIAKNLDENDVLWLSWDNDYFSTWSSEYHLMTINDKNGSAVGFTSDFVNEISDGRIGLKVFFSTDINHDDPFTITIDRGMIGFVDPYGVRVYSKGEDVTFWLAGVSGIDTVNQDEMSAVCYDLLGRQCRSIQGLGIKGGKKVYTVIR